MYFNVEIQKEIGNGTTQDGKEWYSYLVRDKYNEAFSIFSPVPLVAGDVKSVHCYNRRDKEGKYNLVIMLGNPPTLNDKL